jgi:hypothetical protein
MRKESGMAHELPLAEILRLRPDWPRYALVGKYVVLEGGKADLGRAIERMESSRTYFKNELAEAYSFKTQHGADYSDFTHRFDDNARMVRELDLAISYLEELVAEAAG